MADVVSAVNQVLEEERVGGAFRRIRVKVDSRPEADAEAVLEALRVRRDWQGWICFQSRVVALPLERLPEDAGLPLSAELAHGDESLHLLPDGAGGWILTEIREGEGDEALADDVVHLIRGERGGRLHYRRYWRREASGFAPFAARLVRLADMKEERA